MAARWIERRFERLIWKFWLEHCAGGVEPPRKRWLLHHWGDRSIQHLSRDHAPAHQYEERCCQDNHLDG